MQQAGLYLRDDEFHNPLLLPNATKCEQIEWKRRLVKNHTNENGSSSSFWGDKAEVLIADFAEW